MKTKPGVYKILEGGGKKSKIPRGREGKREGKRKGKGEGKWEGKGKKESKRKRGRVTTEERDGWGRMGKGER